VSIAGDIEAKLQARVVGQRKAIDAARRLCSTRVR
jgi:hypothetical protein